MITTLVQQQDITIEDVVVDYIKDNIVISYFVNDGEIKVAEISTSYLIEYLKCFLPDYLAEFWYKSRHDGGKKEFNSGDMLEDFKRKKALQKRFLLYYLNK